MNQKEVIKYYENNGGLRCKDWSVGEIKDYIKSDLGKKQRVYTKTCNLLKRTAEISQQ